MRTIEITTEKPYRMTVGEGLLSRLTGFFDCSNRRVLVVTDGTLARLYPRLARGALMVPGGAREVGECVLPAGEKAKNLGAVRKIYRELDRMNCGRGDLVLAFGGGVVGDIAGFAAATWCRGMGLVQVPTTLLAMADSSLGGKTGVDWGQRKNAVGAFHQPEAVVADTALLSSLPARQLSNGMAEVIKSAMIGDPGLLDILESANPPMEELAARAAAVKALIVSRDPLEKGERAFLNFGHSFGHAIEAFHHYKKWLHGEAVSIGMILASPSERLARILERWGLPLSDPAMDPSRLVRILSGDKKVHRGSLRFVRIDEPGKPRLELVEESRLEAFARETAEAAAAFLSSRPSSRKART